MKFEEFTSSFEKEVYILTEDHDKLRMVTNKCLQLIDYIGNKIGNGNPIKYINEEKEEYWEYKEFEVNEYQTDLFFIRNSNRIKLIFNVIKKQNPDIMRKRCAEAKSAMKVNPDIIDSEDNQECLPDLYTHKRRWNVIKRYIRKHVPESKTIKALKAVKWRSRYTLKKQGKEMQTIHLTRHYQDCFNIAEKAWLEAAFYDEYTDVKLIDIIYEKRYELE
jgi:hypothetical protein